MDFVIDEGQEQRKKITGLAIVIVFHIALVYALMHGLGHQVTVVFQNVPEFHLVDEVKDIPLPTATQELPMPTQITTPATTILPPVLPVQTEQSADTITGVVGDSFPPGLGDGTGPTASTEVQAHVPVRVAAVVDARACQKPAYPAASLRNEEAGIVSLSFLVGADGRVLDSKVDQTSGYRGLDNAARSALSLCKFKSGTVDGKPEQFWTKMQYVWTLEQ
jgi:protein TonB